MLRKLTLLTVPFLLLACGGGAPQTTEAIQAAVQAHLTSRGDLDMNEMGVTVQSVRYKEGSAEADVTIGAGDNPNAQMQMRYTLHDEDGKWVVQKPDAPGAHSGAAPAPAGELPPDHPPVEQQLPEGHPDVPPAAPNKKAVPPAL